MATIQIHIHQLFGYIHKHLHIYIYISGLFKLFLGSSLNSIISKPEIG